jgi:type I restriction enzyme, S subunit
MSSRSDAPTRLIIRQWGEMDRWSLPTGQLFGTSVPSDWRRVKVSDLISQVTEKVRVQPGLSYKMAGVRWYGEGVFHRETTSGEALSSAYVTPLCPGALIYNRLFAWKASFAVVPQDLSDCFVSNEFPQFQVDPYSVLAEYLYLVCITDEVVRAIDVSSTGSAAVSRHRFKEEEFLAFEIPLPSLSWQEKVVAYWKETQGEAREARRRAEELSRESGKQFLIDVGLEARGKLDLPRAFAVPWSAVEKWGVQMVGLRKREVSAFPEHRLSELARIGSGGTPSRKRQDFFKGDIPWVKTTEVRNEVILSTEETLTEAGLKGSSAKIYPAGSLIMAMYGQGATRGRTAKLGIAAATNQACAVLFDIKPNLDVDFLWYFLMSQYEIIRAEASGNNQPNLGIKMIADLLVPVPPSAEQHRIVARMAHARAEAADAHQAVIEFQIAARAEIKSLLAGELLRSMEA